MSITVEVRGGNLEKALRVLKKESTKVRYCYNSIRDKKYFSETV